MPVCPLNDAGPRVEPPVSVPRPPSVSPAATAIPVPELEPAALRGRSHGFCGIGKGISGSGIPIANSLSTVLPSRTAPSRTQLHNDGRVVPGAPRGVEHLAIGGSRGRLRGGDVLRGVRDALQ